MGKLVGMRYVRAAARLIAAIGLAIGVTYVPAEAADDERTYSLSNVELAQAFTAALNAHDVDALLTLFTEEDAGPMVSADRFAWQKFEIRLWALQQVAANAYADAYDYQATERGASWSADMYRDDWRAVGAERVSVTNTIWVHNGEVAEFTSRLVEPSDLELLGPLWRPGAAPELRASTCKWHAKRLRTAMPKTCC